MALSLEQTRELNRMDRLHVFLGHEVAVTDTFKPMKKRVGLYSTHFDELQILAQGKNTVTKGITEDKTALREDVATEGEFICSMAHSYADEINDAELAAKVNYSHDNFLRLKEADVLPTVTAVAKVVRPLIGTGDFDDYEVTAANLDEWLKNADSFTNLIGVAQEGDTHNTVDSAEIDKKIDTMRNDIAGMRKLLVRFSKTNPKFVQGFELNSVLENTGIRHNGAEGSVKDDKGVAVAGAVIRLKDSRYVAKSDLNGLYKLMEVKAGDYVVVVSAEGFVPQEMVIHISPRKMLDLNFVVKGS